MRGKGFLRMVCAGIVGAVLVVAAPALGHGVQHALFAHNADKVDSLHANQLVRVGGATSSAVQTHVGGGVIVSTTITAPAGGYLLVQANSDAYNFDTFFYPACYIAVNGSVVLWSVMYFDHVDTSEDDCATSAIGTVVAGTYTIALAADADAFTQWGATNLQVLFVPFGPTGNRVSSGNSQPLIAPGSPRLGDPLPTRSPASGEKSGKVTGAIPNKALNVSRADAAAGFDAPEVRS